MLTDEVPRRSSSCECLDKTNTYASDVQLTTTMQAVLKKLTVSVIYFEPNAIPLFTDLNMTTAQEPPERSRGKTLN